MDLNQNFFNIDKSQYIHENYLFFAVYDSYPVSNGHVLIISKKLYEDYFELPIEHRVMLLHTIDAVKEILDNKFNPDGYNIGANCGKSSGQTIPHFHYHIIPRYNGDMEDPRGGIRHCIPSRGNYLL